MQAVLSYHPVGSITFGIIRKFIAKAQDRKFSSAVVEDPGIVCKSAQRLFVFQACAYDLRQKQADCSRISV
jgi:hypothetical protein